MTLELDQAELPHAERAELSYRILAGDGEALRERNYDVEHEKRMHLILVRRDLTGFQHLHPQIGKDGTWSMSVTLPEPGTYRVFADYGRRGESVTLGSDLTVAGSYEPAALPAERYTASTPRRL